MVDWGYDEIQWNRQRHLKSKNAIYSCKVPRVIDDRPALDRREVSKPNNEIIHKFLRNMEKSSSIVKIYPLINKHILPRRLDISLVKNYHTKM